MSKKKQIEPSAKENKIKTGVYISKRVESLYRKVKRRKVIFTTVLTLFVLSLMLYIGILLTSDDNDPVKISVSKNQTASLTLSANNFKDQSPYLQADAPEDITNITYSSIPLTDIDSVYGSHNGENYIAYTFELKNTSKMEIDVQEELIITSTTKGIERAVRVMIYTNGVPKIYASPITGTDEAEPISSDTPNLTTPFVDSYTILKNTVEDFSIDAIRKYTIVIWIEGSDPDCVDSAIGSEFRVAFNFKIVDGDSK